MLAYVSLSLLPPWQKMARTGTHDSIGLFDPLLNITDKSVVINKLRQDKSGQNLTCSGVFLWTLKRLISCLFVL